jgi:hypothetical protein
MGTRSITATEVSVTVKSTIRNTLSDNQTAQLQHGQLFLSGAISDGVSAGEVNRAWEDRARTLASGATEDIDLYDLGAIDIGAGAGCDGLGQAIILEEIVTLVIKHVSGTGKLEIMPTNPTAYATWVPKMTVALGNALKAGGLLLMHQPDTAAFDISDTVSHVIRLGANGGDLVYDIMILGRHDDDESSSSSSSTSTSTSTTSTSASTTSASSLSTTSASSVNSSSSRTSTTS